MFEAWLNYWRRWMFWWLPGGDTSEETTSRGTGTQASKPKQPSSETAADGGTAAQAPASAGASGDRQGADDLTAIKGIGPAIARKLEAEGVRTFADLAAADPEQIAARLDSRPVTAERVRSWAAEARKRAG